MAGWSPRGWTASADGWTATASWARFSPSGAAVLNPASLHGRTAHANAQALARYAALCQEAGIVPVVEPEVLMDGGHPIAACQAATRVLAAAFGELDAMGVDPRGIVLKPSMIVSGVGHEEQAGPAEVARATLQILTATVPPASSGNRVPVRKTVQ